MAAKSAAAADVGPLTRCDDVRPRMAKADLASVTIYETREKYGRILRRASELASLNRDQTADALGVDAAQITRWWKGEENAHAWRYHNHPALRPALRLAEAEDAQANGADVVVETVIRFQKASGQ